ncbi:MAG: hypothetical protein NT154_47510, partial [Verrucomicrobia bacterium]|nr:hypothetical protein [Verrucomicrobiota bacterium]
YITLDLGGSDTYSFWLVAGEADVNQVMTMACPNVTTSIPSVVQVIWNPTNRFEGLPFPATGFNLSGQKTMPGPTAVGVGLEQMDYDVTWNFNPTGAAEIEVVVDDSTALGAFRPLGALNGSLGNTIELTARLLEKGKVTPPQNATVLRWIWEFTSVSHEPGVLMNYPRFADADTKPDLRFEENPTFQVAADGQRAESLPPSAGTNSVIKVGSYDWGGFGAVKITCELTDGRKFVGYLQGDPQQTEIRLPKRPLGSFIADIWKEKNGVPGKSDNADDEDDPIGDGSKGDGLTLYQEYRGFMENGKRVEGNPKKKDFWINTRGGDQFLQGILLFRRLAGLEVHFKLSDSEMEDDRTINRNYDAGPRTTNQHAVMLRVNDNIAGFAIAVGGPGTPGMVTSIYIPVRTQVVYEDSLLGEAQVNYRNTTVTHELLHACNVWHHGDAGDYNTVWVRGVGTDNVTEGAQPISVIWEESGENVNYRQPLVRQVKIGGFSGACSGNQACVMRYDDCLAYAPRLSPGI